jgi:DHA1 family bicyclomycin/chloramphenicol resistance-like MFS transporter
MRKEQWSSGEPLGKGPAMATTHAPSAPARKALGEREVLWMMALLMALNAFGIDAILPALDALAADLSVSGNDRQFVIGVYLLTGGIGALVPGALADRFGRRPILLGAIAVYIALSILSALAPTYDALIVVRAAQGFFAAGIVALPPAIIRDRVGGDKMARMMSLIFVIFLMVPAIAPTIGEAIVQSFGSWRAIFAAMVVLGVVMGAWVFIRLPESLTEENRQPIELTSIVRNMTRALTLPSTFGYVIGSALVFGALFGFINSSQQLIAQTFGAGDIFPLVFAICAGSMAIASWSNSRIVERFGARRVSHTALFAFIIVSAVQVMFAFQPKEQLWHFVPLMAINMALLGFIGSNFGAIAMNPYFAIAGAASSAHGFVRMTTAAMLGGAIGYAYDGTARPLALALLASGLVCLALVLWSEKGRLFGPSDAEMGMKGAPAE